jgi:PAS domain S-box-containing protein
MPRRGPGGARFPARSGSMPGTTVRDRRRDYPRFMGHDRTSSDEIPFAPYPTFREVLESVREYAIFLLMPDNVIASWNRGVEEIFGYGRSEFVGLSGETVFVPEDVEAGIPKEEMAIAVREGAAGDNRWHLRKDGSRFWANGAMTALTGSDGEVIGFVKVLRDNTEQREADDALQRAHAELERRVEERTTELRETVKELRRSENLFAAIFRAGPFAAAVTDTKSGRFLEVNDAFCALTGYSHEEVAGGAIENIANWYSDETRSRLESLGGRIEGFRNEELELLTKSGEARTVLASEVPVPLNGKRGSLMMFFDITDRKRSEDELMQAIQDVMQDASWFSRSVVERLAEIRAGSVDTTRVAELTRRERQVLERVARGRSNAEIAGELGIAAQTVRNYITAVYEKIGVKSRVEAVVWARERGLGL